MAATIKDVAKLAGVGVGTVSRVLNGGDKVHEETKKTVLNAVKELEYVPNSMGVRLRTNKNKVIALLIPVINHPFFSELTNYIEYYAAEQGYSLLLVCSQSNVHKELDIIYKVKRKEVDGAIFVTHYMHESLELKDCAIVSIDRHLSDSIPLVTTDNYEATRKGILYLIEKGCKKIGYIGSKPYVDSEVMLREKAYKDVMQEKQMPACYLNEIISHGEEAEVVKKFLKLYPDVDGIFVSGYVMSQEIYKEELTRGKQIPKDIQIVSYDGIFSEFDQLKLTCIQQPIQKIAEKAVEVLIDLIQEEPTEQYNELQTQFIIGNSTKI